MNICDFEAVTLVDYQGVIASVIFTSGCNLRCRFCHNPELVIGKSQNKTAEFLKYIKSSKVDGVSVTGGEPLINKGLPDFLRQIKDLGLKVKLDTNGFLPELLEKVLENNLADYLAIDIKGLNDDEVKYITRRDVEIESFYKTLNLAKKYSVDFELRLTVWKTFDEENIKTFCQKISDSKLYLQRARKDGILDKRFSANIGSVDFNKVKESFEKYKKIFVR